MGIGKGKIAKKDFLDKINAIHHELNIDFDIFIAIKDDPETIMLEQQYRELQHNLIKIYSEGDFLETTLKQLCEIGFCINP